MVAGLASVDTVNLFLVYSPLHCLAAESIAEHQELNARNYLYYLRPGFDALLRSQVWLEMRFLPWPRFHPLPGLLGRTKRLLNNLRVLAEDCHGAASIRIHTPVIDTEAINYAINYLRQRVPTARLTVRLIPDGLLNIQRNPLGLLQELYQYVKKLRYLPVPGLSYYTFRGDRTGAESPIVDRIYVLPGFPHEYPSEKVVELPPFVRCEEAAADGDASRALVLGQPLVDFGLMSQETMQRVSSGIRQFIEQNGIREVDYKGHPRDRNEEFREPGYRSVTTAVPFEAYLLQHPYRLVVGISSTALVTARYILPPESRIVAYGLEEVQFKRKCLHRNLEEMFKKLDIEMCTSVPRRSDG